MVNELLQNISPYDESIYLVHTFVCINDLFITQGILKAYKYACEKADCW